MPSVTYRIVEHDGGFAYAANGAYSETFATHDAALAAARDAAQRQHGGIEPHAIEYEDAKGEWHTEIARDTGVDTRVDDDTA